MYKKNDKIKLEIIDMTNEGLGVAKIDSQVFYVKDSILGDTVNAIITKNDNNEKSKKNKIIYAKAFEIIKESKYRCDSPCPVSNSCGGCQIMSMTYDKQIAFKENKILNNLKRIGAFSEEELRKKYTGILSMEYPYHFRNKIQIPFAKRNNKIISGFYATRTHYIIENKNCIIGFDESEKIISIIKNEICEKIFCEHNNFITIYDELTNNGILREVMIRKGNDGKEMSMTLILNDNIDKNIDFYKFIANIIIDKYNKIKNENDASITTITANENKEKNNVLFGKNNFILYGNGYIKDTLCNLTFHISPESFYQINIKQTEKLYKLALDFANINGNETILDLYCGIGTISLYFAKYVKKVIGVELVEKAIINANENKKINNLNNAEFIVGDAKNISSLLKNTQFDIIIVDPPRKGLDIDTINYIINSNTKKLIYISCDSATLSRDLKILCENNYNIENIKAVDMFPHSMHVETVILLSRKDVHERIKFDVNVEDRRKM